jgi:endonuclease G
MKKLVVLLSFLIPISFIAVPAHAQCEDSCYSNGEVVCLDGVTDLRDGSQLSLKCKSKECNKCGSSVPALALNENNEPVSVNKTYEPKSDFHCNGHLKYGVPGLEDQLLCRESYAVGYDYHKKVPSWVAYHLTPDSVNRKFKRSNRFMPDTAIPYRYRSTLSDYKGTGYDRGHMAASASVDSSYNAMLESFLLSNMAPQFSGLNRQGWRYLEQYIRKWTNQRGELFVVTGTLFEGPHIIIGNGVHVPSHFYKVVYDSISKSAIAFIVPHRAISKSELSGFIVSIDEVEMRTGLDFNHLLDDSLEDDIEKKVEHMW